MPMHSASSAPEAHRALRTPSALRCALPLDSRSRRIAGVTLIDLLVGMAVGLLTALVAMQTLALSERLGRQTNAVNDSQMNGAMALDMLSRDLRMAGFGLVSTENDGLLALCSNGILEAYNATRTPASLSLSSGGFAPVVINPPAAMVAPGDANTSVLLITYAGGATVGAGASFTQPSPASASYFVPDRTRFRTGDLVVAAEPGKRCTLFQVTGLPGSGQCGAPAGGSQVLLRTSGNFRDAYQNCQNVPGVWNSPGAPGETYTSGKLYRLGPPTQFVSRAYAVRAGRLTVCDLYTDNCANPALVSDTNVWVPIIDRVVSLAAQYGRDNGAGGVANDGRVDIWDTVMPTTPEQWRQLIAVRFVVVTQARERERDPITLTPPTWQGGTLNLSGLPDWRNYRYRNVETTVPLKNVIWGSQ